jgi:hypothetical protein
MSTVELSNDGQSSSSSSSSVQKKRPFVDTVGTAAPCELLALSKETEPLFKKINGAVFPFKLAGAWPRTRRARPCTHVVRADLFYSSLRKSAVSCALSAVAVLPVSDAAPKRRASEVCPVRVCVQWSVSC